MQVLLVQFGGEFVEVTPLTLAQWIGCLIIASGSIGVGVILRMIPVPERGGPSPPQAKTDVKRLLKKSMSKEENK